MYIILDISKRNYCTETAIKIKEKVNIVPRTCFDLFLTI